MGESFHSHGHDPMLSSVSFFTDSEHWGLWLLVVCLSLFVFFWLVEKPWTQLCLQGCSWVFFYFAPSFPCVIRGGGSRMIWIYAVINIFPKYLFPFAVLATRKWMEISIRQWYFNFSQNSWKSLVFSFVLTYLLAWISWQIIWKSDYTAFLTLVIPQKIAVKVLHMDILTFLQRTCLTGINMYTKDHTVFTINILFAVNESLINLLPINLISNDHITLMYIQGKYFPNVISAHGQLIRQWTRVQRRHGFFWQTQWQLRNRMSISKFSYMEATFHL